MFRYGTLHALYIIISEKRNKCDKKFIPKISKHYNNAAVADLNNAFCEHFSIHFLTFPVCLSASPLCCKADQKIISAKVTTSPVRHVVFPSRTFIDLITEAFNLLEPFLIASDESISVSISVAVIGSQESYCGLSRRDRYLATLASPSIIVCNRGFTINEHSLVSAVNITIDEDQGFVYMLTIYIY